MLTLRRVPLAALQINPENPRVHGEENLRAITASLTQFGQAEPLVVQRSSQRVIGGNGRVAAMQGLGWTEADVVELDLDDARAAALGIALNRCASLAAWDEPVLVKLLEELEAGGHLDGTGYSPADIEKLIAEIEAAQGPKEIEDPGPEEPPETPVSRAGDLWLLGEHRLLCGDSTTPEAVDRVMAGEQAALVATDSPYVIGYTGDRPNDSGKDWTDTYHEIAIEDAEAFFRSAFTQILRVMAPHAAFYLWHAHKRCGLIQRLWEELGIHDAQSVVWVKPTAVFGRSFWHYQHEPCIMGWRKGSMPPHDGKHEFSTVWTVDWDGKARIATDHPTSKPPELFARPMRKHTAPGAIVFEPFSGSGSQLIAAERERRRCRAIEIEPAYVDVAVKRWQTAVNAPAVLDGDGRTFAEVAKERAVP